MEFSSQEQNAVAAVGRKLATLRLISEIRPHNNADALELAIIDGWQCVVKKGEFFADTQYVVYLEIDSWVPTEIAPFLSKGKEPREYEGVKGERLRTVKLRGEVSQGLVLPFDVLPYEFRAAVRTPAADGSLHGVDVSEILNVKKWERPMAANMQGNARRYFPNFIRKTDQERVQNRLRTLEGRDPEEVFEVTLKIDGSSTTFYHYNGDTGVCSRNLELKTDESNEGNLFVQMYHKLEIDRKLREFHAATGRNIAVQGELWGEGINGNWEGVKGVFFHVFDVFDCDKYRYLSADKRYEIVNALGLLHVPVLARGTLAELELGSLKIDDFLAYADRPSLHNSVAEGVVFKSLSDPDFSFKAINNKYLLNGGE